MFGIASLLLASLYVFGQRDVKRLLAYSSVVHMGILAIGVSFGAPRGEEDAMTAAVTRHVQQPGFRGIALNRSTTVTPETIISNK